MTTRWRRRADRFTTAGVCPTACGTSTTSSSGNYRLGEFQGAVLNGQLDRLEEQTATRDRERPAPGVAACGACPVCIRSAIRPNARGTAITCSCCGSTPAVFGAPRAAVVRRAGGRGHSVLRRLRVFAAGPAAVPEQGVRSVPAQAAAPGSTTARPAVPTAISSAGSRRIWLGQNLLLGSARTWTTSPARSRKIASQPTRAELKYA